MQVQRSIIVDTEFTKIKKKQMFKVPHRNYSHDQIFPNILHLIHDIYRRKKADQSEIKRLEGPMRAKLTYFSSRKENNSINNNVKFMATIAKG